MSSFSPTDCLCISQDDAQSNDPQARATSPSQRLYFLDLPAELRQRIYHFVFTDTRVNHWCSYWSGHLQPIVSFDLPTEPKLCTALLGTSRKVFCEAIDVFNAESTFCFAAYFLPTHQYVEAQRWAFIRNVELRCDDGLGFQCDKLCVARFPNLQQATLTRSHGAKMDCLMSEYHVLDRSMITEWINERLVKEAPGLDDRWRSYQRDRMSVVADRGVRIEMRGEHWLQWMVSPEPRWNAVQGSEGVDCSWRGWFAGETWVRQWKYEFRTDEFVFTKDVFFDSLDIPSELGRGGTEEAKTSLAKLRDFHVGIEGLLDP